MKLCFFNKKQIKYKLSKIKFYNYSLFTAVSHQYSPQKTPQPRGFRIRDGSRDHF